ncbi:hypothetical protein NDU88_000609 [Pleurodeles waltl]|uniref:Uncharacterized protein n=1 Tax=Pleurodeles waltl TaxID=8319 RepID=A0AAV7LDK4_PLEWA|nr:hypothetical protein NDU88_000609 [Pleurodeles waltl]
MAWCRTEGTMPGPVPRGAWPGTVPRGAKPGLIQYRGEQSLYHATNREKQLQEAGVKQYQEVNTGRNHLEQWAALEMLPPGGETEPPP